MACIPTPKKCYPRKNPREICFPGGFFVQNAAWSMGGVRGRAAIGCMRRVSNCLLPRGCAKWLICIGHRSVLPSVPVASAMLFYVLASAQPLQILLSFCRVDPARPFDLPRRTRIATYVSAPLKKATATAPGPACVPTTLPMLVCRMAASCPQKSARLSSMYFCKSASESPV